MDNSKDRNNFSLDNNIRLTNSSVVKNKELEDYMKKLDEEFQWQQAQKCEVVER